MVGVEAGGLVLPGHVVLNQVPHAGLAAAHLEAVAVPRRRVERAVVGVAVAHRPRALDGDGDLLVDEVVAVVRVPPGPAAPDDGRGARRLVVDPETVCVLSLALR